MDVERALVSRALRAQSLKAATERQIEPHHFLQRRHGDETKIALPGEVYQWMLDHLRRFRSVPSLELARVRFTSFEFIESADSLESIVEAMVALVNRRELITASRLLAEAADNPAKALLADVIAFEAASNLARAIPTSSVTRFSDSLSRLALYQQREISGETPGISFCDQTLDDLTYGAQPSDLVIIEGFLGVKKSTLMVLVCARAYFERNATPLFHSLEMDGDKLAARWDAMAAGFKYSAMKRLKLGEGDLKKWYEIGEKADNSKFEKDIIVEDSQRHPTADSIFASIQRWRPTFTVVDTIDEVRAPKHLKQVWEQQDYAARELKGVARSTKSPLFAVAQAGRDAAEHGATIGNIANSIGIPRKADIVVGIHATEQMKKTHMAELRLLKNRDDGGEGTPMTRYFNPGTMELRPWTPADAVATRPA